MPLPAERTVTGKYVNPVTGEPYDGRTGEHYVIFEPVPDRWTDQAGNQILLGGGRVNLDETGSFAEDVVCTDVDDVLPEDGRLWRLRQYVGGAWSVQYLQVPTGSGPIDITDVGSVDLCGIEYVPVPGPPGPATEVTGVAPVQVTTQAPGKAQVSLEPGAEGQVLTTADGQAQWVNPSGGGGSSTWGGILGTLSNQADLKAALDAKLSASLAGAANGVASLDSSGMVPLPQLPRGGPLGLATLDATGKLSLGQLSSDIPASYVNSGTLDSARIPDLSSLYLTASQKGSANGVASLDSSGKVPNSQLPAATPLGMATLDADGKLVQTQIPDTDAAKVTSGAFDPARIPDLSSAYVAVTEVGAADGVASLGSDGKVPAGQLDVITGGLDTATLSGGNIRPNTVNPLAIDIDPLTGRIVDYSTNPPTVTDVQTDDVITVELDSIAQERGITWLLMGADHSVFQQETRPSPEDRRNFLVLGFVLQDGGSIVLAHSIPTVIEQPVNQLYDLLDAIGAFNLSGNSISPNGNNLILNHEPGRVFSRGWNYWDGSSRTNSPHIVSTVGAIPASWVHVTRDGDISPASATATVDVGHYDLDGVLTPATEPVVHQLYVFPTSDGSEIHVLQYGQQTFASLDDAVRQAAAAPITVNPALPGNAVLLAYLAVSPTATDLSDPAQAQVIIASAFGGSGGSGGGGGGGYAQLSGAEFTGPVGSVREESDSIAEYARTTADTSHRFRRLVDGTQQWGSGSAPMDAELRRLAAGLLAFLDTDVLVGQDGAKALRLRQSGTNVGVDASAADLFVSVWELAGFAGAQRTYLRLEATAQLAHAIGTWAFAADSDGSAVHTLDAANNKLGLHGATPVARQTVSGARSTGAALQSLLQALNLVGLINDTSTAGPDMVQTVNGESGPDVTLDAADVGADPAGSATAAGSAAVSAAAADAATKYTPLTDPRLTDSRTPVAHADTHASGGTDSLTPGAIGALSASQKGTASGVASLDAGTKVPVAQIPNLPASQINSGTLDVARIPDLSSLYLAASRLGAANGVASLGANGKVPAGQLPASTVANVRDYGAVGDGTADDTTAIQAAINAANGVGGGTVYLPRGEYKISSALTIYNHIALVGDGDYVTNIVQSSTTAHGLVGNNLSYVTIKSLRLTGPNSGNGEGIAFMTEFDYCIIEDVTVTNFGSTGIDIEQPIVSHFVKVKSRLNGGAGFYIHGTGSGAGTSLSMDACWAHDNVSNGYSFYNMTYCSLNACAADNQINSGKSGYLLNTCIGFNLSGCGSENNNIGVTFTGGGSHVVNGFFNYSNPSGGMGFWVTGGASDIQLNAINESAPNASALRWVQVDTGCSATVRGSSHTTADQFASGTTVRYSNASGTEAVAGSRAAGQNLVVGATAPLGDNGVGEIQVANATTVPTTNPTGGATAYAQGGVLKVRQADGTVVTVQNPPVTSVNGKTGAASLTASDVSAVPTSAVGAASGVASLDSGSKVPTGQIPALPASQIGSGTFATARIPDLSATYVAVSQKGVASGVATLDASTKIPTAQIPDLPASQINSGTFAVGQIPDLSSVYLAIGQKGAASGVASLDATTKIPVAQIPSLPASQINSGVLDPARLPDLSGTYVTTGRIGAASGVASLDAGSKVPAAQLPDLSSTYLATSAAGAANGVASLDATTKIPVAQVPSLPASQIASGTFAAARIPDLSAAYLTVAQRAAANGVASLDSASQVPVAQIPSLAYLPSAGGNLTGPITSTGASAAAILVAGIVSGDGFDRYRLTADGGQAWGSGAAARDTTLRRSAAGVLATDNTFAALTGLQVGSVSTDFGGGAGVVSIKNATTVPTANPTNGGILYAQGGVLKVRQSDGTVVTLQNPPVTSVNGSTGAVSVTPASISAVATSAVGAASGVASLDSSSKVPVAQIPSLSSTYLTVSQRGAANGVASLDASSLVPTSQLPDQRVLVGETGRKYRLLSGVIRNTGSGWAFINDTGHQPSGFTGVTATTTYLTLAHAVGGLKVSSFQITPDETFASLGIRVGASVGVDSTNVYIYREPEDRISDFIQWDSTNGWTSQNGVFTGLSFASGVLTVTHEAMGTDKHHSIAIANRGGVLAQAAALTDTTFQVAFYSGSFGSLASVTTAASTMRFYVTRYGRRATVPSENPANVVSANGNFWITGLIEV